MQKYKIDGVDVEGGDDFSKYAGAICVKSFGNSPYVRIYDMSSGFYRGPRSFDFRG